MSIRQKITVPAILLIVLSIATVLATVILVFSRFVDNSVYTDVDVFADVLEARLESRKEESKLGAMAVAGDLQLRAAMESGSRQRVLARAQELLDQTSIEFLTVTDAQGIVLARAHEADKYGDDMSGHQDVQASLRGESLTLVQEGPIVRLSIHTGQAVYGRDNSLIGTITTGYRLDTNDFVDDMQQIIHCEVTVFLGNTRIATTVRQEDGTRATGLALDDAISRQVLSGEKFSGAMDVVGKEMYAVYLPLQSGQGEIVGMIFAGRYTSTKSAVIQEFMLLSLVVGAALIVVGTICMVLVGKRVTSPIGAMVEAAESLAQGDVNISIQVETSDEMKALEEAFAAMIDSSKAQAGVISRIAGGDLRGEIHPRSHRDVVGRALQQMLDNNNQVFEQISHAASHVAAASQQVADGSQQLARTNMEQAADFAQLNQTVLDMGESTISNAQRARQAASLAEEIHTRAEQGSQKMARMMDGVKEIHTASQAIEGVIKAIEAIAFQTNILSLNAAVEAARAGNQGRGFAVVAQEVRNLSVKSAQAAKNSADMLRDTQIKAQLGSAIAGETAQSLDNIVAGINQSAALMEEISRFNAKQAEAVAQITQSTRSINESVQFTSTLAEETSSASQVMFAQADLLKKLVGSFRLRDQDSSAPTQDREGAESRGLSLHP